MELKTKIKNVIIIFLTLFFSYINIVNASTTTINKDTNTIADVGSFESYDSGSDWGGSSSSWDYDYDYDYGYGGSSYSGDSDISDLFWLIYFFGGLGIVIFIIIKSSKNQPSRPMPRTNNISVSPEVEQRVENQIKAIDPMFNREEFLSWSRSVFIKLQEAWTARDWSIIRTFETNELFEQHQKQLQGYIDNNQINVMERICVKSVALASFAQTGDKEIVNVVLASKMVDYIIDATTNKILKGDKTTDRHSVYRLTFVRKAGVKTKAGTSEVNTTNCPNCGAPTQITSSGKCDYCGSVITTGEHNWVLSNLTKIG